MDTVIIGEKMSIKSIRPKVIFSEVETKFPNQNVSFTVNIPTSEIGGLTLLESSILVSLIKLINPSYLFEFGTYMGATTLLFATNTKSEAKIISLDIDPQELELENIDVDQSKLLIDQKENDNFLRNNFASNGAKYVKCLDRELQKKIELILQNSLKLAPEKREFLKKFDLIFIDGGHEYHIVEKDTENALKMAKENSIIIWHDYKSSIHSDVTNFINEFSLAHNLYHVENTMLIIMPIGKYSEIFNN